MAELAARDTRHHLNGARLLYAAIAMNRLPPPIVSTADLANALTVSVLERSHEIGILRSIGAPHPCHPPHLCAETLTHAVAGWMIGTRPDTCRGR